MLSVIATNPMCARAAKKAGAEQVYVPALNYKRGTSQLAGAAISETQAGYPKGINLMMSAVCHDTEGKSLETKWGYNEEVIALEHKSKTVLADSVAAVEFAISTNKQFVIGPHIPVLNSSTAKLFRELGAAKIWLSPELSIKQIRNLISATNITKSDDKIEFGLTIIGYQELMITEHCELMSMGDCLQNCINCSRRQRAHFLKDRKNYRFPVVTDALGRSHIYNSVQTDNCHAVADLQKAGVTNFMVDSTLMTAEQTAQAVGRLNAALRLASEGKQIDKPKSTTTGHLFREIN